jgi:serine/threonine protein phosphatase PrpC
MPLTLRTAARSDVGLVRTNNEDSAYVGPRLLVVADGMGGHAAGEIASSTVVAALLPLDEEDPGPDLGAVLKKGVAAANERLRIAVDTSEQLEGMGTTLTAFLWDGARLGVAQVGDSRAYLLREGTIRQLTLDQTFVQSLVNEGRLTPAQAEQHPQRSLLLQALDGRTDVEPVFLLAQPRAGDRYLLCSDGLSDYVSIETIQSSLSAATPDLAADALVDSALDAGAPDNVTVVVADVIDEDDAVPESRRRLLGAAARETPAGPPGRPVDDGQEDTADEAAESMMRPSSGPAHATDAGRPLWIVPVALLIVLGLVAAGGFWRWSQNQWYVGVSAGVVAVYQGVEVDTPIIKLHHVVERTDLVATTLPQFEREQVSGGIPARNRAAADATVLRLQQAAQRCLADPTTEGCPS